MANIDITDQGSTLNNGVLQLENGIAMDTTLRYVADQLNTKSQLLLATNATTVEGTLKIKTSNVEYLDVEDALGNNRFTISKAVGSQKVDLDFASNPTGSTTIVGAIRTYKDGISLSNTMVFREDGNVGIGETTSPSGLLHVDGGASVPRIILDADTNVARIFSFRTNDTQRWAFRIDDNETGTNAGSNFFIRRYNDAGTFIDAPLSITRSSGNIGINTATTTSAKITIKGTGSTSATTSLLVQNSLGNSALSITDDLRANFGGSIRLTSGNIYVNLTSTSSDAFITGVNGTTNFYVTAGGRLKSNRILAEDVNGAGTLSNSAIMQINSTTLGFLPPRMTTAQKNAIATPDAGLVVYDTNLNKLCVYTTAWETITSI